jgi:hypothetical protein
MDIDDEEITMSAAGPGVAGTGSIPVVKEMTRSGAEAAQNNCWFCDRHECLSVVSYVIGAYPYSGCAYSKKGVFMKTRFQY